MSRHEPDAISVGCAVIEAGRERVVVTRARRSAEVERGPAQSQQLQPSGRKVRRCGIYIETDWGAVESGGIAEAVFPDDIGQEFAAAALVVELAARQGVPGDWEDLHWTLVRASIQEATAAAILEPLRVSFTAGFDLSAVRGYAWWPLAALRYWSGPRPFATDAWDFMEALYPTSAEAEAITEEPLARLGVRIAKPFYESAPSGVVTLTGEYADGRIHPNVPVMGTLPAGVAFYAQPLFEIG